MYSSPRCSINRREKMEETFVVMHRVPEEGFPSSHLLMNITKGKPYQVVEKYMRSVAVIDDDNNKVWVSGKVFKKHFKAVKGV